MMMKAVSICLAVILGIAQMSLAEEFTQCQLISVLRSNDVPENELATWLCLAEHESSLNSAARGGPNSDGSYDNGIFQLNNKYWCSDSGEGGECHLNCEALRDNILTDDIQCARKIKSEDGFEAWTTFQFCQNPGLPNC